MTGLPFWNLRSFFFGNNNPRGPDSSHLEQAKMIRSAVTSYSAQLIEQAGKVLPASAAQAHSETVEKPKPAESGANGLEQVKGRLKELRAAMGILPVETRKELVATLETVEQAQPHPMIEQVPAALSKAKAASGAWLDDVPAREWPGHKIVKEWRGYYNELRRPKSPEVTLQKFPLEAPGPSSRRRRTPRPKATNTSSSSPWLDPPAPAAGVSLFSQARKGLGEDQ